MRTAKAVLLTLLVLILVVLHQDWWNWHQIRPLVFGYLPIGLAYHAGYSVACAILMWLLVKLAWPAHLEEVPDAKRDDKAGGH